MAGSWASSRLRHWVMQVSLWLILAATLALAAALRHHLEGLRRVRLAEATSIGELSLRPPRLWIQRHTPDGLVFEEPSTQAGGRRRLEIWRARSDVFLSPVDYLSRTGWDLRVRDTAPLLTSAAGSPHGVIKPLRIAGWGGIMISQSRLVRMAGLRRIVAWKQTLACAILPGGEAILLRLEGEGLPQASDEQLVRDVADSMSLEGWPPPRSGGELELAHDIRLSVPAEFQSSDTSGTFQVSRLLIAPDASSWLAVEVVPCIFPPGEKPQILGGILMLRDPLFRPGAIRSVDANTSLCVSQSDELRPSAAYLRVHADGRALLAEFRWQRSDKGDPDIAAMWNRIAAGLEFHPQTQVPRMLDVGAAAVGKRPHDAAELLQGAEPEETWQWYHDALAWQQSRATILYSKDAQAIIAVQSTSRSPPLGPSGRERSSWRLSRDWSTYDYWMARIGAGAVLSQESQLSGGGIKTIVREGPSEIARGSAPVPPLFIPGGALPLLLGRLPFEPMILRSESIITPVGWSTPAVLTLILEPSFDLPRFLPGQKEPMPCWSIRVSGSSESSRWYLDNAGRLQSISFAGGVHFQRDSLAPATRDSIPSADLPETRPSENGE